MPAVPGSHCLLQQSGRNASLSDPSSPSSCCQQSWAQLEMLVIQEWGLLPISHWRKIFCTQSWQETNLLMNVWQVDLVCLKMRQLLKWKVETSSWNVTFCDRLSLRYYLKTPCKCWCKPPVPPCIPDIFPMTKLIMMLLCSGQSGLMTWLKMKLCLCSSFQASHQIFFSLWRVTCTKYLGVLCHGKRPFSVSAQVLFSWQYEINLNLHKCYQQPLCISF